MTDRTPQTDDKYVLRLPDGMRDRIKAAAQKSGRSMNAEIVDRLEASLTGTEELPKTIKSLQSQMKAIAAVVEQTNKDVRRMYEKAERTKD